jgi:hypothetical protein
MLCACLERKAADPVSDRQWLILKAASTAIRLRRTSCRHSKTSGQAADRVREMSAGENKALLTTFFSIDKGN